MKKYLVKKTYTATKENKYHKKGETEIYFVGKEQSFVELCDYIIDYGWSRRYFAEKYIQNDIDFETTMKQDFWKIEYEIIEVEI